MATRQPAYTHTKHTKHTKMRFCTKFVASLMYHVMCDARFPRVRARRRHHSTYTYVTHFVVCASGDR